MFENYTRNGWGADGGWSWNRLTKSGWMELARQSEQDISKALVTGQDIVQPSDTGGRVLRTQFLHNRLERASFDEEDAIGMRLIPKEKAWSTAIENRILRLYGAKGTGFLPETGSNGLFGITGTDDTFLAQVQNIHYMGARREIDVPAQEVRSVGGAEAIQVEEEAATLELIGKANRALYDGDSLTSTVEWNGLRRQIQDYVRTVDNTAIGSVFDAQGQPLTEELLRDVQKTIRKQMGRITLGLTSVDAKADFEKSLFPKERVTMGQETIAGVSSTVFTGEWKTRIVDDLFIKANRPLAVEGTGSDGLPLATSDTGAPTWTTSPFTGAGGSVAAGSAGSGFFLANKTLNTDSSALSTTPAVPSGTTGQQSNQLSSAGGTAYYAASLVYDGLESQAWVLGAASANATASATGTAYTAGQVITITMNLAANMSGFGSTYLRNRIKIRIYRCDLAGGPTAMSDFKFLDEVGVPTTGNTTTYVDNGLYKPGGDTFFGITESRRGQSQWSFLQLLPLMHRDLPQTELSNPFAVLLMATPMLWVPKLHVEVRNIGQPS